MRIIQTKEFLKISYKNLEIQPKWINPDVNGQGTSFFSNYTIVPDSPKDIKKRWKRKQRRITKDNKDEMPKGSI